MLIKTAKIEKDSYHRTTNFTIKFSKSDNKYCLSNLSQPMVMICRRSKPSIGPFWSR